MHERCGNVEDLCSLFNEQNYEKKNIFTWNTLISTFARNRDSTRAMECFTQMKKEGVKPNEVTWNSLISAFERSGDPNRLLSMYAKNGKLDDASLALDL